MQDTENVKIESISEPQSSKESSKESPKSSQEIPITRLHECSDGKRRNDQEYEAYKLKQKQFEKDPEMFVHVDDLVMAVVVRGNGKAFVFGRYSIEECKCAFMTLQVKFFSALQEFEYKMQVDMAKRAIVTPNGNNGKIIT